MQREYNQVVYQLVKEGVFFFFRFYRLVHLELEHQKIALRDMMQLFPALAHLLHFMELRFYVSLK